MHVIHVLVYINVRQCTYVTKICQPFRKKLALITFMFHLRGEILRSVQIRIWLR